MVPRWGESVCVCMLHIDTEKLVIMLVTTPIPKSMGWVALYRPGDTNLALPLPTLPTGDTTIMQLPTDFSLP